jgi:hypothetical protein
MQAVNWCDKSLLLEKLEVGVVEVINVSKKTLYAHRDLTV